MDSMLRSLYDAVVIIPEEIMSKKGRKVILIFRQTKSEGGGIQAKPAREH